MKANLSIGLALYLIGLLTAYGQHGITYQFGVIGGLNAGQIKNSSGIQAILWRYNTGIALEQRFSPVIAIAYELVYSRQGETVNLSAGGITPIQGKQIITFDYVALPIMLRFRPKGERGFLEVGGQAGYLVNNAYYITSPFNLGNNFKHTHQLDAGLTGGFGYRFGKHLVVDARYYYGMKPILADFAEVDPQTGVSTFYRQDKWYNRVYQLNLSYFFK